MNIREGARLGTHMLMDACDKRCGNSNFMVPFEKVEVLQ
jgi:hypothetical protein|tara:strand:- start:249 stop:365 length:117 start_codon:yes stop_codon:yes gene_type:complete